MEEIVITYKNKKIEKLCNNIKEAKKQLGDKVGRNLMLRIKQLKAFQNLAMVPSSLPFRREKLTNYQNRWSVRIDKGFRLEFIAIEPEENLKLIEKIKIVEVSNHYE